MQNFLRFSGSAAAVLAFAAFAPTAVAQNVRVFTCQDVGGGPPESLGDREGHSISINQGSCRVEGAYAGGVSTNEVIWEWDGPKAVELSGSGIVRKPGSTLAWKETEGKLTLTMTDGKVTGLPTVYQAVILAAEDGLKAVPDLSMAQATLRRRSATERRARPWL